MTETTTRVERTFHFSVGGDVKTVELRRLTGKGTDAMATDGGIKCAGTKWTVDSPGGVKVGTEAEAAPAKDGSISFKMKASEAVLITFHR